MTPLATMAAEPPASGQAGSAAEPDAVQSNLEIASEESGAEQPQNASAMEPWALAADMSYPSLPDFAAITDVKLKKQAFFAYLAPAVNELNLRITRQRNWLVDLQAKLEAGEPIDAQTTALWAVLLQEYRQEQTLPLESATVADLLQRVDQVPLSLVLVQAANESAWGTSRFALEGNNLFGQWCFSPGCGLVPANRGAGQTHEVKRFESVKASVFGYLQNLNTNASYLELRMLRSGMRATDEALDPALLAQGLHAYSIRGGAYIGELVSMLSFNQALLDQAQQNLDI